ncbi:hypothetical protein MKW94_030931 [Papaver nudicaule]|uniref:K Homology domain-containing protein n=1 Tax=Papaver nudicaule TaxID=74823 RepID=A0AA41VDK0_PAPNU|nr:hypothetical protein [Papaver nudicaule]
MAEETQFASTKRKYEENSPPPPTSTGPRRPTGFSAPIISSVSPPDSTNNPPSYNNVPPPASTPADEIQLAKQRAQEIAARLFNSAEAKRPRNENGTPIEDPNDVPKGGFSSPLPPSEHTSYRSSGFSNSGFSNSGSQGGGGGPGGIPTSYGQFQGSSKKIEIPNGRVGVIIGKGGETIKYLQLQSGAKIQVTRDMDSDPHSQTRLVELMGSSEQISKAEQLITDVLSEQAEAGGSGLVSRRFNGPAGAGAGQFQMQVPSNKVGLVIGKGGETIKSMQASSGARIQLIPLHPPPGDTSTERTVYIDGTQEQIDAAKELVKEVISENRRNSSMGGGYSQQGYRPPRPQSSYAGYPPQSQQPGYGYMQPGAYPGAPPPYSQSGYAGYPPQPSSGWDQSSAPPSQQTTQGGGYDYYNQQSQQPSQGGSAPADNSGYNYGQPAAPYGQQQASYGESGYAQPAGGQQGYQQEDYSGGGYHAPASQAGYGQQPGYDQSQGYGSAPAYGTSTQDAAAPAPAYGAAQGAPNPAQQAPPAAGAGYAGQQSGSTTAVSYPSQPGYGAPPTTQPGYGGQPPAQTGYAQPSYGPPVGQKPPPPGQAAYGQSQPPSSGAYAQTAPAQTGYSQPPTAAQPGYYGAPAGTPQAGYGAQQQAYGEAYGGYSQPAPAYPTDSSTGNGHGSYESSAPGGAPPAPQSAVAKASPQS